MRLELKLLDLPEFLDLMKKKKLIIIFFFLKRVLRNLRLSTDTIKGYS